MTISLLAVGYAVIALGVLLLRFQWTTPQMQRRRGALHRARTRLENVSSALRKKEADIVEISSELQGVFFGYIADKWDGTEQGMTTNDACRILADNRTPEPLIRAIRMILESLDAVKYGGMDIRSLDELTHTATTLLQQLDRS
jgi:Flp pilus assembly protein TadB